jgi:preprotein translocase subunit SecE
MKTMADDNKSGGGNKPVEPAAPREGILTRIARAPEFFAQVRQEGAKVTWPTLAETRVTTIAVFIMIALSIVFFAIVDFTLSTLVKFVLGLV